MASLHSAAVGSDVPKLDRRAYDHPLEDQPQIKAAWWAAAGLAGVLMWLAAWAIILKLVGVL